jgi:hypothetical protein
MPTRGPQASLAPRMPGYREMREVGVSDQEAHEATVAAVLGETPRVSQGVVSSQLCSPQAQPTRSLRLGVLRSALGGSSFSQCERPRDGGMMTHGLSGRPQTPPGGGQLPNNALAPSKFLKAP